LALNVTLADHAEPAARNGAERPREIREAAGGGPRSAQARRGPTHEDRDEEKEEKEEEEK
jgi:hypothetical protein